MISQERILQLKDKILASSTTTTRIAKAVLIKIIREAMIGVDLVPPSIDYLEKKVETFFTNYRKGLSDERTKDAIKSSLIALCYDFMKHSKLFYWCRALV
jgi:hypothetical protein